MKAVVSGSAGFIGSHLVDELLARGYRVTGIDRQPRPPDDGYDHVLADLSEEPVGLVAKALTTADVVFHLAAKPGVRGSSPSIEQARRRDNVVATRNLLSLVPPGTPLVATSSSSVYGNSGGRASRETDPLSPRGGYARSKVAMERLCEQRREAGGLVAVIRPFTVAGEGQRPDMAFSLWLDALRRGQPMTILGSESRSRDITDVRDAVEGMIRAGERQVDATLNLGTGVAHRLIDMARALVEASGIDGDIVRRSVPTDEVGATLADTARCRALLDFVPSTDLPSLLARQVAASAPAGALVGT